jgi:hypothetical protein
MLLENVTSAGVVPAPLLALQIIPELATAQPDLIFALLSAKPEDINFDIVSSGAVSFLRRRS